MQQRTMKTILMTCALSFAGCAIDELEEADEVAVRASSLEEVVVVGKRPRMTNEFDWGSSGGGGYVSPGASFGGGGGGVNIAALKARCAKSYKTCIDRVTIVYDLCEIEFQNLRQTDPVGGDIKLLECQGVRQDNVDACMQASNECLANNR